MQSPERSRGNTRKILRRLLPLFIIMLFVFLAPVVPTTVTLISVPPYRNMCHGLILSTDPLLQQISAYASISYAVAQGVMELTSHENQGTLGLIVAPYNETNIIQFPPIGYTHPKCL